MNQAQTTPVDIVVGGGGFGGLEAALYLRRCVGDRARVTLVSDKVDFLFRPHLIYVPFGFTPDQAKIDLDQVAETNGIHFVRERVRTVIPEQQSLQLGSGSLSYDFLIIATGARPAPSGVPGLEKRAHAVWRESDLLLLRSTFDRLQREAGQGRERRVVFLVPPQSQWAGPLYELAFMLAQWLRDREGGGAHRLSFLTPEATFMEALGPTLHVPLAAGFEQHGIDAQPGRVVLHVEEEALVMKDGERIPFDDLIISPTYRAAVSWAGLPTDEHGFLRTELATRQVVGHTGIYAVGDGSDYPVKQAFLALLQADAAAEHLAAGLLGIEPGFTFQPSILWVMEQIQQVLITWGAPVPGGKRDQAEFIGDQAEFIEAVPPGLHQRVLLREHLPWQARTNNPLYAGLLWKGTQVGWGMLSHLMKH